MNFRGVFEKAKDQDCVLYFDGQNLTLDSLDDNFYNLQYVQNSNVRHGPNKQVPNANQAVQPSKHDNSARQENKEIANINKNHMTNQQTEGQLTPKSQKFGDVNKMSVDHEKQRSQEQDTSIGKKDVKNLQTQQQGGSIQKRPNIQNNEESMQEQKPQEKQIEEPTLKQQQIMLKQQRAIKQQQQKTQQGQQVRRRTPPPIKQQQPHKQQTDKSQNAAQANNMQDQRQNNQIKRQEQQRPHQQQTQKQHVQKSQGNDTDHKLQQPPQPLLKQNDGGQKVAPKKVDTTQQAQQTPQVQDTQMKSQRQEQPQSQQGLKDPKYVATGNQSSQPSTVSNLQNTQSQMLADQLELELLASGGDDSEKEQDNRSSQNQQGATRGHKRGRPRSKDDPRKAMEREQRTKRMKEDRERMAKERKEQAEQEKEQQKEQKQKIEQSKIQAERQGRLQQLLHPTPNPVSAQNKQVAQQNQSLNEHKQMPQPQSVVQQQAKQVALQQQAAVLQQQNHQLQQQQQQLMAQKGQDTQQQQVTPPQQYMQQQQQANFQSQNNAQYRQVLKGQQQSQQFPAIQERIPQNFNTAQNQGFNSAQPPAYSKSHPFGQVHHQSQKYNNLQQTSQYQPIQVQQQQPDEYYQQVRLQQQQQQQQKQLNQQQHQKQQLQLQQQQLQYQQQQASIKDQQQMREQYQPQKLSQQQQQQRQQQVFQQQPSQLQQAQPQLQQTPSQKMSQAQFEQTFPKPQRQFLVQKIKNLQDELQYVNRQASQQKQLYQKQNLNQQEKIQINLQMQELKNEQQAIYQQVFDIKSQMQARQQQRNPSQNLGTMRAQELTQQPFGNPPNNNFQGVTQDPAQKLRSSNDSQRQYVASPAKPFQYKGRASQEDQFLYAQQKDIQLQKQREQQEMSKQNVDSSYVQDARFNQAPPKAGPPVQQNQIRVSEQQNQPQRMPQDGEQTQQRRLEEQLSKKFFEEQMKMDGPAFKPQAQQVAPAQANAKGTTDNTQGVNQAQHPLYQQSLQQSQIQQELQRRQSVQSQEGNGGNMYARPFSSNYKGQNVPQGPSVYNRNAEIRAQSQFQQVPQIQSSPPNQKTPVPVASKEKNTISFESGQIPDESYRVTHQPTPRPMGGHQRIISSEVSSMARPNNSVLLNQQQQYQQAQAQQLQAQQRTQTSQQQYSKQHQSVFQSSTNMAAPPPYQANLDVMANYSQLPAVQHFSAHQSLEQPGPPHLYPNYSQQQSMQPQNNRSLTSQSSIPQGSEAQFQSEQQFPFHQMQGMSSQGKNIPPQPVQSYNRYGASEAPPRKSSIPNQLPFYSQPVGSQIRPPQGQPMVSNVQKPPGMPPQSSGVGHNTHPYQGQVPLQVVRNQAPQVQSQSQTKDPIQQRQQPQQQWQQKQLDGQQYARVDSVQRQIPPQPPSSQQPPNANPQNPFAPSGGQQTDAQMESPFTNGRGGNPYKADDDLGYVESQLLKIDNSSMKLNDFMSRPLEEMSFQSLFREDSGNSQPKQQNLFDMLDLDKDLMLDVESQLKESDKTQGENNQQKGEILEVVKDKQKMQEAKINTQEAQRQYQRQKQETQGNNLNQPPQVGQGQPGTDRQGQTGANPIQNRKNNPEQSNYDKTPARNKPPQSSQNAAGAGNQQRSKTGQQQHQQKPKFNFHDYHKLNQNQQKNAYPSQQNQVINKQQVPAQGGNKQSINNSSPSSSTNDSSDNNSSDDSSSDTNSS